MNKLNLDKVELKIPNIAAGGCVPHIVRQIQAAENRAKAAERKARLYFWAGITTSVLCTIGGWLLGKFF